MSGLHRHGHILRLTGHLRRDRHRRRVGFKRGCAVAYTDKGTGSGVHDLATNTVNTKNGVRPDATVAGANSNFTAELTTPELMQFNPWLVSTCTPADGVPARPRGRRHRAGHRADRGHDAAESSGRGLDPHVIGGVAAGVIVTYLTGLAVAV